MRSTTVKTLMLALLILLPSVAIAQTHRATVRGSVTDPAEAVVPGAQITLTNTGTNESRTTASDASGVYAISSLAAGLYNIQVSSSGFVPYSFETIALRVNQELRFDVTLFVSGPALENLVVVSPQTELKKDSASIGM